MLGVRWDVASNTFSFSITIKNRPATRRRLLSVISSVYDPLGFVAPFVLPAKILLQDLCKRKFDWDDPIPQEDLTRWQTLMNALPKLDHFWEEQCFKPRDFVKWNRANYISYLMLLKWPAVLPPISARLIAMAMFIVLSWWGNPGCPRWNLSWYQEWSCPPVCYPQG